ncbi:MAG: crossover junction endodeoxyribonuclease RuvC [Deltaproteobacteria bacterium]|nr:crossover junction endodeoxyribonuclease RuvC [Deltaproteobacteria bacterium]MBW2121597.1 crossover junction endodeoxyribonuclease RuvC [Deltaproteobacteria bacterium]
MADTRRAMGIDPGLAATGFAVVETLERGGHPCEWGGIRTDSRDSMPSRLCRLFDGVSEIMRRWAPDLVVLEDVFVVHRFPRTAIQLGAVRGVVSLAAWKQNIPIAEIKPTEIKKALTGNGRAPKDQIEKCLRRILGIEGRITPNHASDAMALALTGLTRSGWLRL